MVYELKSVNVGKPQFVKRNGEELYTSFIKTPTTGRIAVTKFGLEGDEQADKKHHGGEQKAVCVYPFEHFAYWEEQTGMKMSASAFGENLTIDGVAEDKVYIGDIFKWGDAQLQITHPRTPCQHISFVHTVKTFTKQVTQTGLTGFYAKVIQEGSASLHDSFVRTEQDPNLVSVAEINRLKYKDRNDQEGLERAIQVEALEPELKASFTERLNKLKEQ
ncbi:MOSC domain-containing protein [Pontibacillus sp. HMF3514]|uniref:MOSC domain-containing protein n=1 Tax=Pontibacillus sp. HMF3514 TaxID=2692425 RepID=UPI00131FCCA3|nr:MOSC domain-containing protein [Pontibacillus sp. HMF3514]QHE51027.1 MOSC domain-containing protein [Pontibacillus sp. HMF3514]